jgi:hypothetical protein
MARYPQYYPVYSPQGDFYRPNPIASNFDQGNQQQEDETELDFFRSGSQPRFFALQQAAINSLINSLRGPPGIKMNYLLFLLVVQSLLGIFDFRTSWSSGSSCSSTSSSGSGWNTRPSRSTRTNWTRWPSRPSRCYW